MYIIPSAKKAIKDMHCQLKMPDNVNLETTGHFRSWVSLCSPFPCFKIHLFPNGKNSAFTICVHSYQLQHPLHQSVQDHDNDQIVARLVVDSDACYG